MSAPPTPADFLSDVVKMRETLDKVEAVLVQGTLADRLAVLGYFTLLAEHDARHAGFPQKMVVWFRSVGRRVALTKLKRD